jgi:hypothetical protein
MGGEDYCMRIRLDICIVIIAMSFCTIGYAKDVTKTDKFFYSVLDAVLNTRSGQEPATIDRLYDLNEKSVDAATQLVHLLDYNIGEGPSEILDEMITEKGKSVLPLLYQKKKMPVDCFKKYQSLCIDKKTRNEDIEALIAAIKEGRVLRVE